MQGNKGNARIMINIILTTIVTRRNSIKVEHYCRLENALKNVCEFVTTLIAVEMFCDRIFCDFKRMQKFSKQLPREKKFLSTIYFC